MVADSFPTNPELTCESQIEVTIHKFTLSVSLSQPALSSSSVTQ
jgi:hypothetical protein